MKGLLQLLNMPTLLLQVYALQETRFRFDSIQLSLSYTEKSSSTWDSGCLRSDIPSRGCAACIRGYGPDGFPTLSHKSNELVASPRKSPDGLHFISELGDPCKTLSS